MRHALCTERGKCHESVQQSNTVCEWITHLAKKKQWPNTGSDQLE